MIPRTPFSPLYPVLFSLLLIHSASSSHWLLSHFTAQIVFPDKYKENINPPDQHQLCAAWQTFLDLFFCRIPETCNLFQTGRIYYIYELWISIYSIICLQNLNQPHVLVHTYEDSEELVDPTVRHAGMWGAQSPGGRSLACSELQRLRRSWRLLGNVDRTDGRHSPRDQGLNSSPLWKKAEHTPSAPLTALSGYQD